jgi:DnaJ-class molecular chaperone
MNATHSRLTCERCHGIGYVSTALGKLPCLACSAAEVSTGQESSEVTKNMESIDE